MIRALLFDMDGVLSDSEPISITIGIEYFRSLGFAADSSAFKGNLGAGDRVFFCDTARTLGIRDFSYDDAAAYFRKRYPEVVHGRNIALPGAVDIVRNARKAGMLTAVASSALSWKVQENIRSIGLSENDFDVIATGDDVRRSKPCKDIYELCLIRLGIDGGEAVVFEDTAAGIESGRSAGCRVVSLMTTIDGEMAGKAGADAVISDLSAIPSFSTAEELDSIISDFSGKGHGTVYGANEILPVERKMPRSVVEERARRMAAEARENAYAPYSSFKVGAAVLSAATGRIYSGCNVENSSYGATICAERNAITTAIAAEGTIGIDLLAVCSDDDPPAPPCAVCLQVIAEFSRPETEILLFSPKGTERRFLLSELLPNPFIFPTMRR